MHVTATALRVFCIRPILTLEDDAPARLCLVHHARRGTNGAAWAVPLRRVYRFAGAQTRPRTTTMFPTTKSPSKTHAVSVAPESKAAPIASETVAAMACAKRRGGGAAPSGGRRRG